MSLFIYLNLRNLLYLTPFSPVRRLRFGVGSSPFTIR